MPKLKLTETILRDGQQSLALTRMTTAEMVPILPTLDRVGYHSLEVFGGATFDVCLRHLNEDPWHRLRVLRANLPTAQLQMLFRGQSAFGYRHYPDDIVQSVVQRAAANGINIVRVYDALNDYRNLETAIATAKREHLSVNAAICYTESPVHTTEHFVNCAKEYINLGADAICIKDMAGILRPYEAYQLVKALRAELPSVQLQLHTHTTAGLAAMTVLKAVEVGVEHIDTSLSPFAEGASLPATEAMAAAFANTPYAPTLDTAALEEAAHYFLQIRAKYVKEGLISPLANKPVPFCPFPFMSIRINIHNSPKIMYFSLEISRKWPNSACKYIYNRSFNFVFFYIFATFAQCSNVIINSLRRSYIRNLHIKTSCIMIFKFILILRLTCYMILYILIAFMILCELVYKGFISAICSWYSF